MEEHYRSYKESVTADFPVGFTQYVNNNPDLHKHFVTLAHKIAEYILHEKQDLYLQHLQQHKDTLLKTLISFCKTVDYKNMPLNVWKFTSVVVVYDKFTWIPRYEEQFTHHKGPLFSCWEMSTAFRIGQKVQLLLDKKGDKILTPQQQLISREEVNRPLIQDWTLPL